MSKQRCGIIPCGGKPRGYIQPLTEGGAIKTALITGITGQDGLYLSELLHEKGYRVFCLVRGQNNPKAPMLANTVPFVNLLLFHIVPPHQDAPSAVAKRFFDLTQVLLGRSDGYTISRLRQT